MMENTAKTDDEWGYPHLIWVGRMFGDTICSYILVDLVEFFDENQLAGRFGDDAWGQCVCV